MPKDKRTSTSFAEFITRLGLVAKEPGECHPQSIYVPQHGLSLLEEFRQAREYFEKHGQGHSKLARTNKFRERFVKRHGEDVPMPDTTHSFYNFNGTIVCTLADNEGFIARGGEGLVQFAYGMDGRIYVLKKEHIGLACQRAGVGEGYPGIVEEQQKLESEVSFNTKVGLLAGHAYRGGSPEDFISKKEVRKNYGRTQQSYMLMPYLGPTLYTHLTNQRLQYSPPSQRFRLATRLSFTIYRLHQGYASQDGRPIAHKDIKPHNCTIDSSTIDSIKPIDFEIASHYLDSTAQSEGDKLYMPVNITQCTNRAHDLFSLLRTIYLPKSFTTSPTRIEQRRAEDMCVLSDEDYAQIPEPIKEQYLQTEDGYLSAGMSWQPKANLVAAIYALLEKPEIDTSLIIDACHRNNDALNTIVFLSFAELMETFDTGAVLEVINNTSITQAIAVLSPVMHELSSKMLAEVFRIVRENHNPMDSELYRALHSLATRPPEERMMILNLIKTMKSDTKVSMALSLLNQGQGLRDLSKAIDAIQNIERCKLNLSPQSFKFFLLRPHVDTQEQTSHIIEQCPVDKALRRRQVELSKRMKLIYYLRSQRKYYFEKYNQTKVKVYHAKKTAINELIKQLKTATDSEVHAIFESWLQSKSADLSKRNCNIFKSIGHPHHLIREARDILKFNSQSDDVSYAALVSVRKNSFFKRGGTICEEQLAGVMVEVSEKYFSDTRETPTVHPLAGIILQTSEDYFSEMPESSIAPPPA